MSDELVAQKLRESLAAHRAALVFRHHRDLTNWARQLTTARQLRLAAHEFDPEHTAPAWRDEQSATAQGRDTHVELLAFYEAQLGQEVLPATIRTNSTGAGEVFVTSGGKGYVYNPVKPAKKRRLLPARKAKKPAKKTSRAHVRRKRAKR